MKRFAVFLTILTFIACSKKQEDNYNLAKHIPADTEAIVVTNDFSELLQHIKSNNFLADSEFGLKTKLINQLSYLSNFNFKTETGLSISNLDSKTLVYTITTKKDSGFIQLDSIQNKSVESIQEDGATFKRMNIENSKFFLFETENATIISNSKTKILDIANNRNSLNSNTFKSAYDAADPNKTSIFLNQAALKKMTSIFEKFSFPGFKDFSEWIVLDLDLKKDKLKANGISVHGKQKNFLTNFNGVSPREIEVSKVCPEDFISFYSFSFSSFKDLQKNSKDSIQKSYPNILDNSREAAIIKLKDGELFILNAIESETAKANLAGFGTEIETYRGIPIYEMEKPGVFNSIFSDLILLNENRFYGIIDHFIVFSSDTELIKKTIADHQNSNTIAGKSYYEEIASSLSSESSVLLVSRLPEFYTSIENNSKSSKLKFKKNSLAAFQMIAEDNFTHLHGIFSNSEEQKGSSNGAKQSASFKLEAPVATRAYFFKNHETDQRDILVQDENNTLYLISNKGTIFWKKELDSQISGPIHEVDLFKNGNKQIAFSTGYHLEVLDRNGNTVKPFPIKFNEPLTQPLSVFDYDNNRTYRFVLTQNKRVYMLGPKGKSIKGFDFENAKSNIVKAPKHIRLGTKDYILIAEESGRLNILSRQGSIRVPVNENFKYSENEWYGNDGNFITTEPDSNLITVTQSGAVSRKNLNLADNHRLKANDDLLVYLNENELSIKGKIVSLDFGLYTDPQIFSIGRKTYVSITDLQAQKVFVYDSNAELLSGFPVFGTSEVDISNADLDSRQELIVKGDDNEILLYKL
ncbi:hypothetical protein [Christiangramia sp. SM2212]|uniref:Uncharacterized protein n=1 Tax=Christiangramia sediminicola TaxID=3073267 RepID=A0ABU1EUC1_9FLAO|nr:hypothetical protein [Christiangramia sp. SM2212]MDR5591986.1 hypothetical protein [Christiangramia sp. SM2212]